MFIEKIDRCFLFMSLLLAVAGLSLGIVMGIRQDFSLAPVHAHVNLVGFVTLALFGVAYRVGWAGKDRLALLHFGLAGTGAILLPLGIAVAIASHQTTLAMIGSLLTFASMLLFLINCIRVQWTGQGSSPRAASTDSVQGFPGSGEAAAHLS